MVLSTPTGNLYPSTEGCIDAAQANTASQWLNQGVVAIDQSPGVFVDTDGDPNIADVMETYGMDAKNYEQDVVKSWGT